MWWKSKGIEDGSNEGWPNIELRWVDPSTVGIDDAYQRSLNLQRCRKIAREFDSALFTPINVGEREDGSLYCYDGMHRVQSALIAGIERIPALVLRGTTRSTEARLFAAQNSRNNVAESAKINAEAIGEDALSMQTVALLAEFGLRLSKTGSSADGVVACAKVLRSMYEKAGPQITRRVCKLRADLFGNQAASMSSFVWEACYRLCCAFSDTDWERSNLVLRVRNDGLEALTLKARALCSTDRAYNPNLGVGLARAIVDSYNARRREQYRLSREKIVSSGSGWMLKATGENRATPTQAVITDYSVRQAHLTLANGCPQGAPDVFGEDSA